MPVHPEMLEGAVRGAHKTIDLMVTWGIGRPAQIGGNEAPGLWLTGSAARLLERADPRSLASDLAACNDYQGAEAAAAKVACPVLLLLGGEDRMTPAATAAPFAAAFAAGRTTILPGTGHLMMVEDPAATLAALKTII
jgi:pimeloyl-ACP methyl ester carboxylesterase